MGWTQSASAVLASFLASLVEFVEALTIVLAVGVTRGWRSAITGAFLGAALLTALVAVFGTSLQAIPIRKLQLFVGLLLLVFGMRWLWKAILLASGVLDLHDETKIFARQMEALRLSGEFRNIAIDGVGFITSFKAVLIEGTEVVFIVIAVGATGNMLVPASLGALAAGLLVVLLGLFLHKPLARVPENTLKFSVGVLLSAFGVFWIGEGLHFPWLGQDWVIVSLIIIFSSAALVAVRVITYSSGGCHPIRRF
jgi:uncharacterized membrane protein